MEEERKKEEEAEEKEEEQHASPYEGVPVRPSVGQFNWLDNTVYRKIICIAFGDTLFIYRV